MTQTVDAKKKCTTNCALIAGVVALVLFVFGLSVFDWSFLGALVFAIVAWAICLALLIHFRCNAVSEETSTPAPKAVAPVAEPAPAPKATPVAQAVAATGDTSEAGSENTEVKAITEEGDKDAVADEAPVVDDAASNEESAPTDTAEPEAATADGIRPTTLSAARDGKADDLKQIKGIGPKLEQTCNDLGFFHFDQIANWTAQEVAWVDQNLEGFKGRVTRDKWVEQARTLAGGGETEFSKRVEDGNVY